MDGAVQWHVILLFSVSTGCQLKENHYHSFEEMVTFLQYVNTTFGHLARLYSIGQSVRGKDLWVIEISGGDRKALLRPNIKLVANIHGSESVGRELSLMFIQYLVDEYDRGNPEVVKLLNYANIHVLPSINPDGFDLALDFFNRNNGSLYCDDNQGWLNYNHKDVNRYFPVNGVRSELVPESVAVMRWMDDIPFVLSLSIKGAALVATYPYDMKQGSEVTTKDNDVFKSLALLYSSLHPSMAKGCVHHSVALAFKDGITNGFAWSPTPDSMQDYNYIVHGCLELTVEISCCKFPESDTLVSYWKDNKKPILEFMKQIQKGIRGFIKDEEDALVSNATLTIDGSSFKASTHGEYWRVLPEYTTTLTIYVEAAGFQLLQKVIQLETPQIVNLTLYHMSAQSLLSPPTTESICESVMSTSTRIDYDLLCLIYSWVALRLAYR